MQYAKPFTTFRFASFDIHPEVSEENSESKSYSETELYCSPEKVTMSVAAIKWELLRIEYSALHHLITAVQNREFQETAVMMRIQLMLSVQ